MSKGQSQKVQGTILKAVYDPLTGKQKPEHAVSGTPVKISAQSIGTSASSIYSVPSGSVLAITDIIITNTTSATTVVTIADGTTTLIPINVAAGSNVTIDLKGALTFNTSVTVSATGGGNILLVGVLSS